MHKKNISNERGLVTLFVSLVLLMATTAITFVTAESALMEQRIVGNASRAKEVRHAAEAGLEYGMALLATHNATWISCGNDPSRECSAPDPSPSSVTAIHDYSLDIVYERDPDSPRFIEVISTATAAADANIMAVLRQYIKKQKGPRIEGPPLSLGGCLFNVTGTPDIYPQNPDTANAGTAIATRQTDDPPGSCINPGFADLHGGSIEDEAFSGSVWDHVFDLSEQEIQNLAEEEEEAGIPEEDRTYFWVSDPNPYNNSRGSPQHPVILVFDEVASCPKFSGDPNIYGVVYVMGSCPQSQGWGGATVYGLVIVEGDIVNLNANAEFYHFSEAGVGGLSLFEKLPSVEAPRVPGTWKDF